jgi:hypothetical protein
MKRITFEAMPSPTGRNAERMVIAKLPPGMSVATGQSAVNAVLARPMALDAAIDPERVPETIFEQLHRLAAEAGADINHDSFQAFATKLAELLQGGSVKVKRPDMRDEEPEAADEEREEREDEEREKMAWNKDPEERMRRWTAVDRFLRKKGASDADMEEIRPMWESRYGKLTLPKTAMNGRMGGAIAEDRKRARRRQAFDTRWPDASRLNGSPLESRYGEQPRGAVREATPQGCFDRWPDASKIGVA